MSIVAAILVTAARHGRLLLVAGLLAGIGLPALALALRDWLRELVALLMFVAALRIGPRQAFGALGDLPHVAALALAYQVALPLAVIGGCAAAGLAGTPLATALALMAAASSISGSPNLTILVGGDPAPALRLLVVTTALLPLTVIPVFWLEPELGDLAAVAAASARLFAVIAVATGAAFVLRHVLLRDPPPRTIAALDGLSALAMAVVVIGLMSSAGPALAAEPATFLAWLGAAFAANLGLQLVAWLVLGRIGAGTATTGWSIIAGNRNIALFLVALPRDVTDPLLLFIACYQIPMYLTPIVMRPLYARSALARGSDASA